MGRVGKTPIMNIARNVMRAQFLPAEILNIRKPIETNVMIKTKFVNGAGAIALRFEKSISILTTPTAKDAQSRFIAVTTDCGFPDAGAAFINPPWFRMVRW